MKAKTLKGVNPLYMLEPYTAGNFISQKKTDKKKKSEKRKNASLGKLRTRQGCEAWHRTISLHRKTSLALKITQFLTQFWDSTEFESLVFREYK